FQYRVTMSMMSQTGVSPKFKSFKMALTGGYKIINSGDIVCYPEVWIKKNGFGDVKLINTTNNSVMEFKDIHNNEEVYINCETHYIVSDVAYRYDNHNGQYLKLDVGENIITGEGEFTADFRLEFKT